MTGSLPKKTNVTELYHLIHDDIAENGAMRFDAYMARCLFDPQHGYYTRHAQIGQDCGDFVTAPELTNLFARSLAHWVIAQWHKLGQPQQWRLVELGPGRGTLMAEILQSLGSLSGDMAAIAQSLLSAHMIEISHYLQGVQKETLEKKLSNTYLKNCVQWHNSLNDLPLSTVPTLFIGNEILDAFPMRSVRYHAQKKNLSETYVDIIDNDLALTDLPTTVQNLRQDSPHIALILENHQKNKPDQDLTLDWAPEHPNFISQISRHLTTETAPLNGALLLLDYGHDHYGATSTLQALRAGQPVTLTEDVGLADITAHINFSVIHELLPATLQELCQITTQRSFLQALGIEAMAARTLAQHQKPTTDAQNLSQAVHRLIAPEQMGHLFLALTVEIC